MEKEVFESIHLSWQKGDPGNSFQRRLQKIINKYLHQAQEEKTDQNLRKLTLHLEDDTGAFLGGAVVMMHQDWLEILLLALVKSRRGYGFGRHMLQAIEDKARELDCKRIRTETCEVNVGFYQRCGYKMMGKLDDYPPGLNYFWLHKDLK